jgi:serine/threonine-protein phosphatase PGAM5
VQSQGDEHRRLTELGKRQADLTGRRIAELVKGVDDKFGPCNVKIIHVSNMTRAKETADLIAQHLPSVERGEPDPLLNEGSPAHTIPGGKASKSQIERLDEGHPRIESAFQKYFYREELKEKPEKPLQTPEGQPDAIADLVDATETSRTGIRVPDDDCKHEFEIIVCHANVIRYFICRALQLPPEAWLRICTFNCSLTYFTIRPTGTVSIRSLGDVGHLPYRLTTFSMHHGYNW